MCNLAKGLGIVMALHIVHTKPLLPHKTAPNKNRKTETDF